MIAPTICPRCGLTLAPDRPSDRLGDGRGAEAADSDGPLPPSLGPVGMPTLGSPARDQGILAASFARLDDPTSDPSPTWLGLDLGGGSAPSIAPPRPAETDGEHPLPAEAPRRTPAEVEEECEQAGHRSAWPLALLASYASAATIACGWLWWTGHRPPPADRPGYVAEARAGADGGTAGRRGGASLVVEPPEPIGDGHRVALGETLQLGSLAITPLAVSVGRVELERVRVDGKPERRSGGDDAVRLRLRLKNTSDDAVFAPLDEAFVREPDRRLPEAFIEDGASGRVYAYPLPVASEWGIAGQEFHALRPGESSETVLVSDADARDRLDGPLTWRLRLRIGPEETAVLGVTFDAAEIRGGR